MEGHTTITSLHPDGEPKSPKGVKTIVVNQCGCYVRENIPISFKLWKKTKSTDNDADIVPETEKQMLWADVKQHFSFLEDIFQNTIGSGFSGTCFSVHSVTKSTSACDLIAVRDQKLISRAPNSHAHLAILPMAYLLWRISPIGNSVTIVTLCSSK